MSDYNELINILKYLLTQRFAPMPYYIRGLLGNGAGQVRIPGRPDHNYARFNRSSSESFEVFNKEVSQPVDGLPILIGEFPWQPGLTQVVGIDWMTYEQTGWGQTYASIQAHASTHKWPDGAPGSDYLDIFMRAIYPLRGYSGGSGSMSLYAAPYEYDYTGTNHYWPGLPPISLQGTQPPTGTMRYMGVYLDPGTNTLKAVTGSSAAWADTAQPPRPAWPRNVFPVAYTRVYGGQAYITERDTYDARRIFNTTLMFTGTSAGSGGGVWPLPGRVNISTTEYSTITLAIAAAATGDLIFAGEGTFTENPNVDEDATLRGVDRNRTIVSGTITLSAASASLEKIRASRSSAGTEAILCSGGTNFIDNCYAVHNGVTNARAISCSASATIKNTYAESSGSSTSRALYVSGSTTVFVESTCEFNASGAGTQVGVYADTGATIRLNGPVITATDAAYSGPGTVRGWYRDSLGNIYIIGQTAGTTGLLTFETKAGMSRGVWLIDVSTNYRIRYTTLALALAAAGAGDTIEFDGTQTITANFDLNAAVTLQGVNPETSIINCATDSLTAITMSAAGACCRNFKVTNSGAGTGGAGIFWTASSVILEDLIIEVSGAGTTNYGIGPSGAVTGTVKNVNVTVSGGTNNYGAAFVVGNSTTEIIGGKISGSTYDIYGTVAGATLTTYNTILANGKVSFDGVYPRQSVQPTPTEPIVMNGHPLVWQRGTSFAAAADGTYFADRFGYFKSGTMVHTLSRSADVPTVAQIGSLFSNSLKVDCTTADGTIAAGDYTFIRYIVEGYDWLKLAQQQWTIPFWVYATKTGTYCFAVSNSGSDRSYVAEYTVSASNTFEYKQVTIPASPSAGTWNYTTGVGARLFWTLAGGSTFQTTAGAWQTGNFFSTSNQVNACDDAANDFQLIVGSPVPGPYARPIVPNAHGDYQKLLAACNRYAWLIPPESGDNQGQGAKTTTVNINIQLRHPVSMRTTPTLAHNITGYTAGVPGTTTIGLVNYRLNAFSVITGALTASLQSAGVDYSNLQFVAGTSWDGLAGDLITLRVGPSVVAVLSAEF